MDSQEGLECLHEQLSIHRIDYKEPENKIYTNASRCLLVWMYVKDSHPYLLETSYGKLQTASPFTLHLFPVQEDLDLGTFRQPTDSTLKEIQDHLSDYYGKRTGVTWCRIIPFTGSADEDWFMIRYPGNIECRPVLVGDKEKDDANHPLFFHTVVYDKRNHMLRTTIKNGTLCAKVRVAFGRMYFNNGNAFESSKHVLSSLLKLDKIAKGWKAFCETADGDVIQNIRLSRLSCRFRRMGEIKSVCYLGPNDHLPVADGDLFEANTKHSAEIYDSRKSPVDKLLEAAQYVHWMQLSYELVTDDGLKRRERKVTIKQGNTLGFEQDSGAVHLLDLLYEKKILEKCQ
jgi:hypothetical protein